MHAVQLIQQYQMLQDNVFAMLDFYLQKINVLLLKIAQLSLLLPKQLQLHQFVLVI